MLRLRGKTHPCLRSCRMVTGEGCSAKIFTHGDTFNPTVNATFDILEKLLGEMTGLFPGAFLHLGGDEVPATCWGGNKAVRAWMEQHGMGDNWEALENYFVQRLRALPSVKGSDRIVVHWEEVLNNGVNLPPHNTMIQAWKSNDLPRVLNSSLLAINSYKVYIDGGAPPQASPSQAWLPPRPLGPCHPDTASLPAPALDSPPPSPARPPHGSSHSAL